MIDKNPQYIRSMFDEISTKYDFMNEIISFGIQKKIKKDFIKKLEFHPNTKILDLCTGTGDLAIEITKNKSVNKVIGLDISKNMLEIASSKNKSDKIEFIEGDCLNLPFENDYFDGVTMGFGLRNIDKYEAAINEIKRVLKKGGFFAHIDIFKGHFIVNKFLDFYIKFSAKIFNASKASYKYLTDSKNTFISEKELSQKIENLGLKEIARHSYVFGLIKANVFCKL